MATLKDVAERAQVSMLEAYNTLKVNGGAGVDKQRVLEAAAALHYELRLSLIHI